MFTSCEKSCPRTRRGSGWPAGRGAYRLTVHPHELDVDIFESLVEQGVEARGEKRPEAAVELQRQALAMWRGDPDDDVLDVVTTRHLEEVRLTARYCLADALLDRGEATEAITVLRTVLSEDPLREPAWERLLTAQRAAGWQVDALASYEQARLALLDRFGAEPGSRLQEIYRTLLSETADSPAPPPVLSRPRPVVPVAARRYYPRGLVLAVVGLLLFALAGSAGSGPPAALAPALAAHPKILFGLGGDAVPALRSPVMTAGIGMVTTWYHKSDQLDQFEGWRADLIPRTYGSGRAMHLVVATWDDGESLETRFGRACGQAYPLSEEFLTDMRRLARAFAGPADGPPLYISMFHGLQKLSCANTGYLADPATTNYYLALKERYFTLLKLFHDEAPNAKVALNWDGWTASHDEPEIGAGRSMFQYFVEAMSVSDFQSFNAFVKEGNAEHIRQMVEVLGRYGPVMVSYFGPHENSIAVYQRDPRETFTPETMSLLAAEGLFAFSFRDDEVLRSSPETMTLATGIIRDYGHPAVRGG